MNETLGILQCQYRTRHANCLDENIREMLNDSYDTSCIKLNDTFLIDSFWDSYLASCILLIVFVQLLSNVAVC